MAPEWLPHQLQEVSSLSLSHVFCYFSSENGVIANILTKEIVPPARVALIVPPSVSRHPQLSCLDVDARLTIMLSVHYDPGTSMAVHQRTMRCCRPCGEDIACHRAGFQSHGRSRGKKNIGLSFLQSHRGALGQMGYRSGEGGL